MVDLSTLACILCSAGAGLGAGFFGCILSWANHEKIRNEGRHTPCTRRVAILGVIGSTIFGLGSLAGLYFGPVTLVVVVRAGTLLPANAIFSQLFGFRPLTRDDLLGTLVTVSGVVCFSLFGGVPPPAPHEKEFLEMLFSLGSFITNIILLSILLISLAVVIADRSLMKIGEDNASMRVGLAVANISGCASAFMDVAAKGWSAVLDSGGINHALFSFTFWVALSFNIVFLIAMRLSMIYGCRQCDVLLFVPLSTVMNIFYSVLAGMAVLKEYKQVVSWPGLLAASVSVLGGVVMLVSGPAMQHDDESPPDEGQCPLYTESEESEGGDALLRRPVWHERENAESEEDSGDEACVPLPSMSDSSRSSWLAGGICSCLRTKGTELVTMNHSHWEAARIRKRWFRIRQNWRDVVGVMRTGSEVSPPAPSQGSPTLRRSTTEQSYSCSREEDSEG